MATVDPGYAKMVLPTLERQGEMAAAGYLEKALNKLKNPMKTQIMNSVETLSAKNETRRNGGGAAVSK